VSTACILTLVACAQVDDDPGECVAWRCRDTCRDQGYDGGTCVDRSCTCSGTPHTDGDADSDTDTEGDDDGCVPDCEGRECGADPVCGRSCGTCEDGQVCNDLTATCCDPDCEGRVCGPDGCGGSCSPGCADDEVCIAETGTCCAPSCEDRMCGSDGCGRTCPPGCADDEACDEETGTCCTPECGDRLCGDDGCGGTCPPGCPLGEGCDDVTGTCQDCDLLAATGCGDDERCGLYSPDGGGDTWESGCLPLEPDAPGPGEDCEFIDDPLFGLYDNCQGGMWCVPTGSRRGICHRLCTSDDATNCDSVYPDGSGGTVDGVCNLSIFRDPPVDGLLACLVPAGCDPRCQDCEDSGDICLPASDSADNFATICIPMSRDESLPGTGAAGDECDYANSCLEGLMCLSSGTTNACHPFCDVSGTPPADCDFTACAGTMPTCSSIGDPGWTEIGLGACL
jgi:hypothetical protein